MVWAAAEIYYQIPANLVFSGVYLVLEVFMEREFQEMLEVS